MQLTESSFLMTLYSTSPSKDCGHTDGNVLHRMKNCLSIIDVCTTGLQHTSQSVVSSQCWNPCPDGTHISICA